MIQLLLPPQVYGDRPNFEGVYALPSLRLEMSLSLHLPGVADAWKQDFSVEPSADMRALYTSLSPEDSSQNQLGRHIHSLIFP